MITQNQNFYLTNITFALIMLVIGPILGVFHQETSRSVPNYFFQSSDIDGKDSRDVLTKAEPFLQKYKKELSDLSFKDQLNFIIKNKKLNTTISTQMDHIYKPLNLTVEAIKPFKKKRELITRLWLSEKFQLAAPKIISVGDFQAYRSSLARVHGHFILIGTVLPILMCVLLWFTQQLGGGPITNRSLKFISTCYIVGATSTLALMFIKGFSFHLALKSSIYDWDLMNNYLISGHLFRAVVFGLTHTITFISLNYFIFKIFQSLNARESITEEQIQRKKNRMIKFNGMVWIVVGGTLFYRGIRLFPETSSASFYIAIVIAIIIGAAKGFFVLSKTSTKNVNRIVGLEKPVQYSQTISFKLILLIPLMITFGILLRKYVESIPGNGYTVGAIYVGISFALLTSSIKYWKFDNRKKKTVAI
ncbi:MAG: hypothetical protein COA79_10380 [Planctomycetota bacterium]|nr:MAG: hypothetical protein COA79_10380 [Planctomycetota bacterium]